MREKPVSKKKSCASWHRYGRRDFYRFSALTSVLTAISLSPALSLPFHLTPPPDGSSLQTIKPLHNHYHAEPRLIGTSGMAKKLTAATKMPQGQRVALSMGLVGGGESVPSEKNNDRNDEIGIRGLYGDDREFSGRNAEVSPVAEEERENFNDNEGKLGITPLSESAPPLTASSAVSKNFSLTVEPESSSVLPSPPSGAHFLPGAPPPGVLRRIFPNFPWHRLPDWLTYARCMAIPALALFFHNPLKEGGGTYPALFSGLLFALASFTDWLDGYLARRWRVTSAFGAFLDPVADKLLVSTALVLLSGRYGMVVAGPTTIILGREIAVSALREWMAQRGLRDSVKVGFQGKVKTAATMVALTVLLLVPWPPATGGKNMWFATGLALLYFSALITVTSGSVYFRAAAPVLFEKDGQH